jgi:hypothetical protein
VASATHGRLALGKILETLLEYRAERLGIEIVGKIIRLKTEDTGDLVRTLPALSCLKALLEKAVGQLNSPEIRIVRKQPAVKCIIRDAANGLAEI